MIKQKHQQLFDILAEELRRGVWPRGTKLPNLKELSARHNVSINVASKAVELLKEKKLVTVKVGDGIYSCTSGQDAILEFKYSGRRLFGQYRSAKVLRVLLEDNTTWQREFWNPFFERVTREYPDIELKISYNLADAASVPEGFDIAFGSPEFLHRSGFEQQNCLSYEKLQEFYPQLYSGLLLSPDCLRPSASAYLFPYGALNFELLSHQELPKPLPFENVLGYLERLAEKSSSPLGYSILNSSSLLLNCGLQFGDSEKGHFQMPDEAFLLEQFARCRRLYQAGHLVWLHGRFSNYEEIYALKTDQPIKIVEHFYNRSDSASRKRMQAAGIRFLPYANGEKLLLIPLTAAIRRDCPFPEECLRLLKKLLEPDIQQQMTRHFIAQPIHPAVQPADSELTIACQNNNVQLYFQPKCDSEAIMNYFVGWEFWYYLNDLRQQEVASMITAKAKYYLQTREHAGE